MGFWDKTREAADKIKEASDKALYTQDYSESDAETAVEEMAHDIPPHRLRTKLGNRAPLDVLLESEKIKYYLDGLDLDVDGNDQGSQSYLIVTDQRLIIMSQSITLASNLYTVSYTDIIGVAISRRLSAQVRIQTAGHEYKISAAGSRMELVEDCVGYIREMSQQPNGEMSIGNKSEDDSPLKSLERLADLRDRGAISESEFKTKKSQLLEDI